MYRAWYLGFILFVIWSPAPASTGCGPHGVWLQVLGSGGPEIDDGRASAGYLIWREGKARILVDMGGGSLLRFEQSGAHVSDLDVILLTHLHVDHSADLPYLIKASFFTTRDRDLPIYGPTGNRLMPATTEFVRDLFGPHGAFRYLSSYLDGSENYRLIPHDVIASAKARQLVLATSNYRITAVPVHHGPVPALAYRVEMGGKSIVFSGDMNNDNHTLAGLAAGADLLVAHHAIPEHTNRVARNLHMPPSVIGDIAGRAKVKQLVLSHRMVRTFGHEQESSRLIRLHYQGPLHFAEDLQCFKP
jgi:ribonuclease BN (tRNA processing enzyme)